MGSFPLNTLISFLDTQEVARDHGINIDFGFVASSLVHHARVLLSHVFLTKKIEFGRIFWIDSDVTWKPAEFIQLLLWSLKYDCVCGIYPRRSDPPGYFIRYADGNKEPNDDGLVEIAGCGMGFSVVTRDVMQTLADKSPKLLFPGHSEPMPNVFRCDDDGKEVRGEDYVFWDDVRKAGFKVYADTGVSPGHIGNKIYQCRVS